MASAEAEYGTMGISSPILALPDKSFAFNLTADADKFFQDAQNSRQGSATELQQSALSVGLGVNASFDPAAGAGFLAQMQQYQQGVANNNAAQSFTNLKNSLQNSAAYTQYQADIQAANANTDPTAKANAIATAQSKLATSMVGPTATTLPSFPTSPTPPAPTTNLVSRPTDLLQMFANGGNFAGSQGLRTTPPTLGVTDRTALLTAGGDNATRAMYSMLGDPQLLQQFKDKKVLFEVCTVSIQPGWRTQKGFAADVQTNVMYQWAPARPGVVQQYIKDPGIPAKLREILLTQNPDNVKKLRVELDAIPNVASYTIGQSSIDSAYKYGPHVAVISPLTDTQTLDLQSSDRKEREVALSLTLAAQLAAAGASGQAQSFLKYAQSLQQDFATISPDVVVNAYSTGSIFGFQVGPRLRAVDNPQFGQASGPAQTLDRQSFPALVIYGIEQQAFFPAVLWNEKKERFELWEPMLRQVSVNRWVPSRRRDWSENIRGLDWIARTVFLDREPLPSQAELLNLSKDIDELFPPGDGQSEFSRGDGPSQIALLQRDLEVATKKRNWAQIAKNNAEASFQNAKSALAAKQKHESKDDGLAFEMANLERARQELSAAERDLSDSQKEIEYAEYRLKLTTLPKLLGKQDVTLDRARVRLQGLKTELFGGDSQTYLPLQVLRLGSTPTVASATPSIVPAGTAATVAVIGTDLGDIDLNKIATVVGDVDASGPAATPPFNASIVNGTLILHFTPNVLPIRPRLEEFRSNFQQATRNFDQIVSYSRTLTTDIGKAQKAIENALTSVSMPRELDAAENDLKNKLDAVTKLTDLGGAIADFDEQWAQARGIGWTSAEKTRLDATLKTFMAASAPLTDDAAKLKTDVDSLGAANGAVIDTSAGFGKAVTDDVSAMITKLQPLLTAKIDAEKASAEALEYSENMQLLSVAVGKLQRNYVAIQTQPWSSATQVLVEAFLKDVDTALANLKFPAVVPASLAKLKTDIAKLDIAVGALGRAAVVGRAPPTPGVGKDVSDAVTLVAQDMNALLGPLVHPAPNENALAPDQLDQLQIKAIIDATSQQKALTAPLKRAGSRLSTDAQLNEARVALVKASAAFREAGELDAKLIQAGKDALLVAKENLDEANSINEQLKAAIGTGSGDASASSILSAAEMNILAARQNLTQLTTDVDQTVVFALPSKSDPNAIAYTPQIRVTGADPSDLVLAPQTFQLQAAAGASTTGGVASSGSSTAASGPNVTVLIAGNGLNKVDLANISSVPASKQPLTARLVGNSIAITMSISSADSAIYFDLPIAGTVRHVATPPITVKAAPAASGAGSSSATGSPSVSAISPSTVALSLDPTTQKPVPNFSVPVFLIGTNLDQADLTTLTVVQGGALVDPSAINAPALVGGSIKLTLIVKDATAPIVIGLAAKGTKTPVINSLPIGVTAASK
ncbi:MAG TPA: hypothetical protein VG269_29475 [Tepidisphaeraceae bacterium]|nr:hypothetical protein [Tepidisphaeraceae bacterium]